MWRILQNDVAKDYVIATGETHSVRDFCAAAFRAADLDWEQYVVIDERFYRPAEVDQLIGDASLAKAELDWKPTVSFEELVQMMVEADLDRLAP